MNSPSSYSARISARNSGRIQWIMTRVQSFKGSILKHFGLCF